MSIDRRTPDDVVVKQIRHERRKDWHDPENCDRLLDVDKRFADGDARMALIEKKLDANSAITKASAAGIAEVLDILNLAKSFFRLLGLFGSAVKWVAAIGAPIAALWYAMKGGK